MNLDNYIEQAIRQHEETLHVDDNVQETDVRHAIRWVMRYNPDIFWFVHQYFFDKDNGVVSFRYRCSPKRSSIIQESINDVVENDFQINHVRTLTQLEQVAYIYKWILAYCNYNVNSAYNQNIDSVFVRRNSVCTGYAKAAQYLFKLFGIESRLVFGRLNNDKEDGRHCWNIVCIEGTFYHLDICLGDPVLEDLLAKAGFTGALRFGDFNYNSFCVSTEEITKTRSIEDIDSLPICNKILDKESIESQSRIAINLRNDKTGCLLSHNGSTADIYLCSKDKNVVLKKYRGNDTKKCEEEYGYMDSLKGCILPSVVISRSVKEIGNFAFGHSHIEVLQLPASLHSPYGRQFKDSYIGILRLPCEWKGMVSLDKCNHLHRSGLLDSDVFGYIGWPSTHIEILEFY